DVFAGKKSAQIREILISESAWEEMTCLFAPSLTTTNLQGVDHG
ncbi:MAG: curli production assembly/transport protein CsgE, partial [Gammaproteobacteria bacterium]|nr:curli production assembly/transport protein CsgE [Gammaproteobacteria bacterium]